MPRRFDVIVIGVGAMGASACCHLARRGARVLGLDRFAIPNEMGSSHGESRVLRLCYYEHPDYVPLLRRAHELWHELNQESASPIVQLTGGLYMGRPDGDFIRGTLRAAREHDLPHESLDRAALTKRYPQFTVPDDHVALYEPHAGLLRPERIITTYATLARRAGAELLEHVPVLSWHANGRFVTVETAHETFEAAHLVVCAGAWTGKLMGDLGVKLVVSRQVLAWVRPRRPELFGPERFPIWGIDDPDGYFFYGFPELPDRPGIKLARHHPGRPADPDTLDRAIGPADDADIRLALRQFLPDGQGPVLSMAVCMYTTTPDAHFVIDRHPRHERVSIACGFSGHGFKFASVTGEILAELALDGRSMHPIEFLGLHRFG